MAKVFKKLITEEAIEGLPVWDGVSLIGTTWRFPFGWTSTAEYGKFDVDIKWTTAASFDTILSLATYGFGLWVGYAYPSLPSVDAIVPFENYAVVFNGGFDADGNAIISPRLIPNSEHYTMLIHFFGGTDINNTDLVNWVLENGELKSHQMPTDSL